MRWISIYLTTGVIFRPLASEHTRHSMHRLLQPRILSTNHDSMEANPWASTHPCGHS